MRVIESGVLKEYTTTCPKCGCKYAWTRQDVQLWRGEYPAVFCPECGKLYEVDVMPLRVEVGE